jgi:hypothetical protein
MGCGRRRPQEPEQTATHPAALARPGVYYHTEEQNTAVLEGTLADRINSLHGLVGGTTDLVSGDGANPATCGHLKPGHRGGIGGWYLVE